MKASDFLKSATEQYREEVSGDGVPISIPELGLDFFVFPVQPEETMYVFRGEIDNLKYDQVFAIRLICGRAKKEDGTSIFDNHAERDKAEKMLMTHSPKAFTTTVAARVVTDILDAFPVTTIDEAGNDSGETTSSDSISG